jgi:uncharacterized protein (TIGR03790 family)
MRKLVLFVACLWPAVAMGLTGQETLVVANSASNESVELAKFYMTARQIPQSNLLLLKTTTDYQVSRNEYETALRQPLAEFLKKDGMSDKIRCVVFMWGIPVRVAAGNPTTGSESDEVIRLAVGRAHYRLAMDYQLLARVGRSFPASMPAELLPPSKQFDPPAVTVKEPLDPLPKLLKNIAELVADKQVELRRLRKPEEQAVATRQLMSLHADLYGLTGLLAYINDWKPANAPDPKDIEKLLTEAKKRLDEVRMAPVTAETAGLKAVLTERIGGLALVTSLSPQSGDAPQLMSVAADSDLALVLWSLEDRQKCRQLIRVPTPGQSVPNMLNWRAGAAEDAKLPKVFMTARLDGPTPADVKRDLEAAIATEKTGLSGTVYIDAGVKSIGGNVSPVYTEFDASLKRLAKILTAKTSLKVVLDEKETVFAEGACPDAAVYVGWYSLKNYVPAFKWAAGAVGVHYASYEAMELRDRKSNAWCTRMVQEGVSGTLGAVDEPYLTAFVQPEEFIPLLLTGKLTLGECYWRTSPVANWRFTLIGDPLYNPFAAKPAMKVEDLPKAMQP